MRGSVLIYRYNCSIVCMLQLSGQYELLNYSEHGTTVDNVLYSCDFSVKTPIKPVSTKAGSGGRRHLPLPLTKHADTTASEDKYTIKAHAYKVLTDCFYSATIIHSFWVF